MAKVRRIIRKVRQPYAMAIDDQLWPIFVMLLVLGGFTTGELVVLGTFSTDSLWQSAWMMIAVMWGMIAALVYFVWLVGGVVARRTLLSFVMALLFVSIMLTTFAFIPIFADIILDDDHRDIVKKKQVTLPDYVFQEQLEQDDVQLEHETPVDTVTPETEPLEVEKQEVEQQQEPQEHQPTAEPVPETTPNTEPTPVERQEVRKTPPHKSQATGKLSSQPNPAPSQPDKVASPTVAQESEPKPSTQLEADTPAIQPRQTESAVQRPSQQEEATAESSQPTVQQARRPTQKSNEPRPTTSMPTLERAVRTPTQVPRAEAVAQQAPSTTQQQQPSKLEPSQSVTRQTAESPVVKPKTTDSEIAATQSQPQPQANRASPLPRHQTLAQSRLPSPTRTIQQAATPTTTAAVAAEAATSRQQAPQTQMAAAQPNVSRASPTQSTNAPAKSAPQDVTAAVASQSVAQTRPRLATDSPVPTMSPTNEATSTPRRATAATQVAASPVNVSAPAMVQSAQPNPTAKQPRVAALSRSRQGTAGAGQQRNLDRGELAPRTVSDVASASARRSQATSEVPDPSALTTSAQARVSKDQAMADAPSATLQALADEVAVEAGAQQAADIDATSSAAMRSSSAAQTRGAVTADAGSTDFDTGPTQIASEFSSGRAAGGGEPELHHAAQTPQASLLAPAGGAELAAASVEAFAPEPTEIAQADGGGAPLAPAADNPDIAATRVQDTTATGQSSAAPSATESDSDVLQPTGGTPTVAAARVERTTAAEGLPGASAGGGTEKPMREAAQNFAASTEADLPVVESQIGGEAAPEGIESTAQSIARQDAPAGILGTPGQEPTGAAESDVALNVPNTGARGTRAGRQQPTDDGGEVLQTASDSAGGAPLKVASAANLPGVTDINVEAPELAGGGAPTDANQQAPELGAGEGSLARRESGGRQSLVQAQAGDGGLGVEATPDAGNPNRKAQHHSDVIALATDSRFPQRDVGGPQHSGNTKARDTQSAFEGRKKRPGQDGKQGTPPRALEESIRSGLEFLRLHQSDNGSWSFNDFGQGRSGYEREDATIRSDTAATGLSLMCFLGAGYDHFDFGGKYAKEVQSSIDYLVSNQQPDGSLYVDQDSESSKTAVLYSHAIATMALCEAYGMTRDPKLKKPAQKAMRFIEATQHPERGGWRYVPGKSSDVSVTGWMLAALKSGDLAGLKVKKETYEKVYKYLDRSQDPGSNAAHYVYNPDAPNTATQGHGRRRSPSMTAVGLLGRLYQGWNRTRVEVQRGADYLSDNLPEHIIGERDTYYWYYGTQVMFHMRGSYWEQWERRLHEVLRATQIKRGPLAGSWDPRGSVPDKWGTQGGRVYVTSMNLLSLEVSYRYLPLYQEADR